MTEKATDDRTVTDRLSRFVANARNEQFSPVMRLANDPDFINLAPAQHYRRPGPHIVAALRQAIESGAFPYGRTAGELDLVDAIASRFASHGIEAHPESEVWVTHGAGHAFLLVLQTFLDSGDEVLTVDPSFPLNWYTSELFGAKVVGVSLDDVEEIAAKMEDAVTPRTKAIVWHHVNNPTGHVFSASVTDAVAQVALKHNLLVLADEVYGDFSFDGAEPQHIAARDGLWERTVTISGVSKGHNLPGLRVGWAVGHHLLIGALGRIVRNGPVGASVVSQRGAHAALTGPQDHLTEVAAEFSRTRLEVVSRLNDIPGIRCPMPEGGFFVFPKAAELGLGMDEFYVRAAQEARVGLAPGNWYGAYGADHFRLCYGAAPPDRVHEAIDRVEPLLHR